MDKGFNSLMLPSRIENDKQYLTTSPVIISVLCLLCLLCFSGCTIVISSATTGMMDHLSETILNTDDLKMVESGAPAYLLMIDSLISQDAENEKMLSTAADLYSAYADVFVKDKQRSIKMADKALNYATRAICQSNNEACSLKEKTFKEFETVISGMDKNNVPVLFSLGNAWAGWIMANKSDYNAIADLARIEKIMLQVIKLDENYKDGSAHLFLGAMATFLPPALGGKPETGKQHFETALKLSGGKNLMVKVMYAKMYARMMFDQTLHDKLLTEVLTADQYQDGYTLVNTYARLQAEELLASSDEYFN